MRLSRGDFLKKVLVSAYNTDYTVRDIVLFEANVMGGIHAGSPKMEKEKVLQSINSTIAIGGYRSSLRQLKAIGRVVLKAFEELRQDILNN